MTIKSIYLLRFLVLILFIVSFKKTYSQFGNIRLHIIQVENIDSIPFETRLYSFNNLLIYKCNIYDDAIIYIDSIKQGSYYMEIYRLGVKGLTLHEIIVKQDSVTNLGVDLSSIKHDFKLILNNKRKLQINSSSGLPNFAFSLQTYQPGFSSQKEVVNSMYDFGIKFTPMYFPSKYYGIGANLGTNIAFCKLQKDKIQAFADTFNIEKYFYWKVFAGLNNRFVFVQPKDSKSLRPCFLDIGIGYNFPFIYRYVAQNKDSKRIKGFISNLNDFSITARLGFGFLAFTSSYRITDDLKKTYNAVPRLMFGLDLIIPND